MINQIYQFIYRPESGWDPVPVSYAKRYASKVYKSDIDELFAFLDNFIPDYKNMRILDLGGGPGDFSIEFAKRKATVVCYDVSYNYQLMASKRAASESVDIEMMLGHLDEVPDGLNEKFDLVFNRVCWYYASSDKKMGLVLNRLAKPGGLVFVETNNETYRRPGLFRDLQYFLNRHLHWKIGHPYPPCGRIEKILSSLGLEVLETDYRRKGFDKVIFRKIQTETNESIF